MLSIFKMHFVHSRKYFTHQKCYPTTKLHEYGVKFRRNNITETHHFYNVSFNDKIIVIPYIYIDGKFSTKLYIFLTLYQSSPQYKKEITSEDLSMAHLIDTANDVILLRRKISWKMLDLRRKQWIHWMNSALD